MKSKFAKILDFLKEESITIENNFHSIKEEYFQIKQSELLKQKENIYVGNLTEKFQILNYFTISKREQENTVTHINQYQPPRYPEDEINDVVAQQIYEKVKNGSLRPKELIAFLNKFGINQDSTLILSQIIPFFYIDTVDDAYNYEPPEIIRKYQKEIYWFLVSLLYDEKKYKKLIPGSRNNISFKYPYYSSNINYFKGEINDYVDRLIFDAIQKNKLKDWYNNRPQEIPPEWIEKNIDKRIVHQVYLPNQIDNVPIHIKELTRNHTWKYLILSDLVNKVDQYFDGFRNVFPDSELEKYNNDLHSEFIP